MARGRQKRRLPRRRNTRRSTQRSTRRCAKLCLEGGNKIARQIARQGNQGQVQLQEGRNMGYFRVRVNLGLVIKGPPVDLEGLYEEVRRYADSHGLELIYGEVS